MKQPDGIKYGKGLFETIKIKDEKLEYFEDHLLRLKNSMEFLGISADGIEAEIAREIENTGLVDGALRIMVLEDFEGYSLHIETRLTDYSDKKFEEGLRLKVVEQIRDKFNLLNNHKTNNYLLNHEVLSSVKNLGYDEAVFLNQDRNITEGSYTNLFFIKDCVVVTPPVEDGLLPGVYRKNLIKKLEEKNIECEIRHVSFEELERFDACICTNSLMEKRFVKSIDEIQFEKTEFTKKILEL
ncbi:4-amino-4-deoxychorismate lyase [Peptoniphilus asaccharolyticus DSM 20463]|uniref:4-amino-4-deoxychorismate lyase n=1 Tax=Peptoniphilus asaccharolyticus DSM 20463 TaxID=573058 RepID=A0A1W1VD15_PEPAS|nr:aminotransferase class IV [Peptoniphilus asaccharolyticus]MBL7574571.1 aminotransferase class IV [Peptoniphilus asaccharolyticus]SMB91337.1 4-amino-4-deoxychorismate lyase [Peptoniphilus asaccharolyticus DSM 20463]